MDSLAAFREAVTALNDEPTPANVRRYLAASRLLDLDAAGERSHERVHDEARAEQAVSAVAR